MIIVDVAKELKSSRSLREQQYYYVPESCSVFTRLLITNMDMLCGDKMFL